MEANARSAKRNVKLCGRIRRPLTLALPMNLVAADVSRRICLFSRQRISADSRRRLRFRGLMREIFRGNLSMNPPPHPVPLPPPRGRGYPKGGVRGRFMVLMHAQKRKEASHEPEEHPTSNTQRRTSNGIANPRSLRRSRVRSPHPSDAPGSTNRVSVSTPLQPTATSARTRRA